MKRARTCGWRGTVALLALVLPACSESSTLEVRLRASLSDSTGLAGLILQIDGRGIQASDFHPDESGIAEVRLEVPDQGRLQIRVELLQAGVAVAEGTVGWDLAESYEWGLDIFRQVSDPVESCFGCTGSGRIDLAVEAQGEPGEALWLAWGGRPKGSGIVY